MKEPFYRYRTEDAKKIHDNAEAKISSATAILERQLSDKLAGRGIVKTQQQIRDEVSRDSRIADLRRRLIAGKVYYNHEILSTVYVVPNEPKEFAVFVPRQTQRKEESNLENSYATKLVFKKDKDGNILQNDREPVLDKEKTHYGRAFGAPTGRTLWKHENNLFYMEEEYFIIDGVMKDYTGSFIDLYTRERWPDPNAWRDFQITLNSRRVAKPLIVKLGQLYDAAINRKGRIARIPLN